MKKITTWIAIADAKIMRVVANDGPGKGLYPVSGQTLHAPAVTALSDEPGMTQSSAGPNRGAVAEPDLKGQAEAVFAKQIVSALDVARRNDAFDRLVIVAAPHLLGVLRPHLGAELRASLLAEVDKDLTPMPIDALPPYLSDIMAL